MTNLTAEQKASFDEQGFLNYGPILTESERVLLRDALARTLNGESTAKPEAMRNMTGDEKAVVIQIVNIWEAEPAFFRHLYHDRIVPLVADLMQTDTVRVWHDQVQVKPALVGGPTTWHQDHPYWPVIQPANLVSAWVAIEDADEENGCMSMVPGSHKWGPYKSGTIGTNRETYGPTPDVSLLPPGVSIEPVPCPVKAGGVVFHHCLTWHGAPPNHSPRPRPAIAVHYMPGWTRYEPQPGKTHLVEHQITVAPGEPLQGDHFPTVMKAGQTLPPPPFPSRKDL